ncbi:hypothetical protein B0H17DRAFT_1060585 [Mycena rosella]|uniref:Uncharacterized protein n=1 Tax=Mycena rosella TaxID=1033263 RepID=A0AAD7GFX2_MYCRO|nr:hypothetical protein B0H17DRAFT_1060585 [Mycena rosella]
MSFGAGRGEAGCPSHACHQGRVGCACVCGGLFSQSQTSTRYDLVPRCVEVCY